VLGGGTSNGVSRVVTDGPRLAMGRREPHADWTSDAGKAIRAAPARVGRGTRPWLWPQRRKVSRTAFGPVHRRISYCS